MKVSNFLFYIIFFFTSTLVAQEDLLSPKNLVEGLKLITSNAKPESDKAKPIINKKIFKKFDKNNYKLNKCMENVCELLGSFGCDDHNEIERVYKLCYENNSGKCIPLACEKLGSFGCDTFPEIANVVSACHSNSSGSCFEFTCDRLNSFACDSPEEIIEIINMCRDTPKDCVKNECNKQGSSDCDSYTDISKKAIQCRKASK